MLDAAHAAADGVIAGKPSPARMAMYDPATPPSPLADDPSPEFARFSERGQVHVLKRLRPFGESFGMDFGVAGMLMAQQQAYCGKTGLPGQQYGIGTFADDELCTTCLRRWPHASVLLFEHEIPHGGEE